MKQTWLAHARAPSSTRLDPSAEERWTLCSVDAGVGRSAAAGVRQAGRQGQLEIRLLVVSLQSCVLHSPTSYKAAPASALQCQPPHLSVRLLSCPRDGCLFGKTLRRYSVLAPHSRS